MKNISFIIFVIGGLLTLSGCPVTGGKVARHFILHGGNDYYIASSTDGDTWTPALVPVVSGVIDCAAVDSDGHWVAAGKNKVLLSDNGRNWINATEYPAAEYVMGVSYDGVSRWVLAGGDWDDPKNMLSYSDDGGDTWTTADGETWALPTAVAGTDDLHAVSFGNGKWVAVGRNGIILNSTDGDTWTPAADSGVIGSDNFFGVAFHKGRWVAVSQGGKIFYSNDGDNWTEAVDSGTFSSVSGVTAGP